MTREKDITRRRGDTAPIQLTVKDAAGVAVDITGATFRLVVDPSAEPIVSSANLFDIAGVIVLATAGTVSFSMTAPQADQTPATYYYDIEMTDAAGDITTLLFGKFIFRQDIAK